MQQEPESTPPDVRPKQNPAASIERTLDLLACPACLEPLRNAPSTLACTACGRVYPVLDGIPILLIDRATLPL